MVKPATDLEPGFKMTELGPLPEEWQIVKLSDALILRKESVDPNQFPGLRYVGLEHIDSGDSSLRRWGNSTEVRSSKHHFYEGDILYGKLRPYLDKAVEVKWEGMCSTDILVFEPSKMSIQGFIIYLLHTSDLLKHAISTTTGVNHPRTSWKALSQYTFPLPHLPEQQAIAHVLRTVQHARETTEAVIEAAKKLKRSLMRHLFTYGPVPVDQAEQVKLKDTEIGPVPEEWEVVKLGDVCSISTGTTPSTKRRDYYSGNIPFIKTSEIVNNIIDKASAHITQQAIEDCSLKIYEPGTVFLAMYGQGKTRGQTSLLSIKATTTQNTAALVPQKKLISGYLWIYLMSQYERLRNSGAHGQISHLNLGYVKEIHIPLPPFPMQRKIAEMLTTVDRKIETEQARKTALEALFKTLLANLMTGKIRVKVKK